MKPPPPHHLIPWCTLPPPFNPYPPPLTHCAGTGIPSEGIYRWSSFPGDLAGKESHQIPWPEDPISAKFHLACKVFSRLRENFYFRFSKFPLLFFFYLIYIFIRMFIVWKAFCLCNQLCGRKFLEFFFSYFQIYFFNFIQFFPNLLLLESYLFCHTPIKKSKKYFEIWENLWKVR